MHKILPRKRKKNKGASRARRRRWRELSGEERE
jgi:hypothetical protein